MSLAYKKNIFFKLVSLWLPVVVQMGLIFYFSSQPAGSPALERFPTPPGFGHLVGYALLGFLLYRALYGSLLGWNLIAARNTFIIGVLYAVSDELHQLFVPGRHASVTDVGIDAAGILLALLVIRIYNWRRN